MMMRVTIEYARALVDAFGSNSAITTVDRAAPEFDLYADISAARQQIAFTPMSLADSIKLYANELQS